MNVNLTCRDYDSETASRRLTSDFLSILNATTTITLADIVKTEAQSMTIMTAKLCTTKANATKTRLHFSDGNGGVCGGAARAARGSGGGAARRGQRSPFPPRYHHQLFFGCALHCVYELDSEKHAETFPVGYSQVTNKDLLFLKKTCIQKSYILSTYPRFIR